MSGEDREDIRIVGYEDDFDDLDMEIDLSDIFDEKPNEFAWGEFDGVSDNEILELFNKDKTVVYSEDRDNKHAPKKTMVVSREMIKDAEAQASYAGEAPEEGDESEAEEEAPEDISSELEDIDRKKKKHRRSFFFLKLFLLLVAAGAVIGFALSPVFTIKNVEVEGNRFYTAEQIINMSEVKTGGNLFLNAQKSVIKNNLKKDIYFRSVNVKRRLPSTLVIEVKEKEELAALVYGDKYIVIDDHEEVLRIAKIDPEVTVVKGLKIKAMEVGETIQVEETKKFRETIKALNAMREGDFFFKRIEIGEDKVDAYIYDMMKVEGTYDQIIAAIENSNLQKVVNKLMKSGIKRATIILGDNDYISFSPEV